MVDIKDGEGLCEYIRRQQNELSLETAQKKKSVSKIGKQMGLTILGNEKFITAFREVLYSS